MLENISIFQGLSQSELEAISGIAKRVIFKRGEIIFHQGDVFQDFFVIESGQVEISYSDAFQEKKVLSVLRSHDFFGEMALFDHDAIRSATAKALQSTSLIMISGKEFETLLKEKTSISFKLLGALSKRLRDSNLKVASTVRGAKAKEGKIITIASAKDGYGKTVLATTLAHLLANEISKNILFVDLDIYYGDGTYFMGVSSPRSICEFSILIKKDPFPSNEETLKNLVKVSENLYLLPAPHNFIDAEQVEAGSLVSILKTLRRFFDYIIVDTQSNISDLFLNVLEMSDFIFFLAEAATPIAIRDNSRYFQALSKLNFFPEKVNLLISKISEDFYPERIGIFFKKDLKFKTLSGLPLLKNPPFDYGKNYYNLAPESLYCSILRQLTKNILQEEPRVQKDGNFLHRLFAKYSPSENVLIDNSQMGETTGSLLKTRISENSIRALFSYIRQRMNFGFHDESRVELLHILEFCPKSSLAFLCLGEILLAENNLSDAIPAFSKALENDPKCYMAMGYLGHLTSNDELFNQAVSILNAEIEAHPQYSDLQRNMGKLLMTKGKKNESLVFFRKAIKTNSNFFEARIDLALNLWELGQTEEAIGELCTVSPKNLRVFYLLGKFFYHIGKFPEAREAFHCAANLKAEYLDLQEKLDTLRDYFQKVSVLISKFQNLVAVNPSFPDVHLQLGELYFATGDFQNAQIEFETALTQKRDYTEAKRRLEEVKRYPRYLISPQENQKAASENGKKKFKLELDLKKCLETIEKPLENGHVKMVISNSRTGKEYISSLTQLDIKNSFISLDCSNVGDIFENDVLLIQMVESSTKKLLTNLCHIVSNEEFQTRIGKDIFE